MKCTKRKTAAAAVKEYKRKLLFFVISYANILIFMSQLSGIIQKKNDRDLILKVINWCSTKRMSPYCAGIYARCQLHHAL